MDIAPTLLGILGFGGQVPEHMQGKDVSASLLSHTHPTAAALTPPLTTPHTLYFYYPRNADDVSIRGLRTAIGKFVASFHPVHGLSTSLYDLANAPFEQSNITDATRISHHAAGLRTALADAKQRWAGESALATLIGAP
ncbi:hypothetical protein AOC05_01435 [Arthrobacter alpinus]|uniref:Uncharacterized protein n=1 Tax=Arthrobacter alpinus TaxID=656366 RepID=A0A0M4QKT5_9MICC|nr:MULTISPECIES: hypothetical protein [Arthrobacter]ALE91322.1 hypothetical protein AOC05_01435 [Arthrobacter alpinus]